MEGYPDVAKEQQAALLAWSSGASTWMWAQIWTAAKTENKGKAETRTVRLEDSLRDSWTDKENEIKMNRLKKEVALHRQIGLSFEQEEEEPDQK